MTTVVFDTPEYASGQCIFDNDIRTSNVNYPYRKGWPNWKKVHDDDEDIIFVMIAIDSMEVL